MRLTVVAIGQRMPPWVTQAWTEYSRRFPRGFSPELKEVPAIKRSRNADIESVRRREGEALLLAVPDNTYVIALDEDGRQWTTRELSLQLQEWMHEGRHVAFLVGGPDGLSSESLAQADFRWSLGRLTLPHPLVRIVLAEQLYRAWTITQNHPYHRN
ncbi:MAG: 23S rRNA (pseudouridine(1915)-N(3))-methyltransferase RlmH [Burkholderiales bacterium]